MGGGDSYGWCGGRGIGKEMTELISNGKQDKENEIELEMECGCDALLFCILLAT